MLVDNCKAGPLYKFRDFQLRYKSGDINSDFFNGYYRTLLMKVEKEIKAHENDLLRLRPYLERDFFRDWTFKDLRTLCYNDLDELPGLAKEQLIQFMISNYQSRVQALEHWLPFWQKVRNAKKVKFPKFSKFTPEIQRMIFTRAVPRRRLALNDATQEPYRSGDLLSLMRVNKTAYEAVKSCYLSHLEGQEIIPGGARGTEQHNAFILTVMSVGPTSFMIYFTFTPVVIAW